jgi:hypothetical protein
MRPASDKIVWRGLPPVAEWLPMYGSTEAARSAKPVKAWHPCARAGVPGTRPMPLLSGAE